VQQAKIKPILEQEAGDAGQMISILCLADDKLEKLENIVRSSTMVEADPLHRSVQTLGMRKQQKGTAESLAGKPKDQG
jgi:hypothetical protein